MKTESAKGQVKANLRASLIHICASPTRIVPKEAGWMNGPVGYTGPVSELRENVTVLKHLIVGSSLTCTVRNSHWYLVQSAKTPVSRSVRFVQSAKPVGTDQVQTVWNVMWDLSHFAMPSWAL